MDLEEYYDSLEEDSNYGSLESLEELSIKNKLKKSKRASKIPIKTKAKQGLDISFTQEDDVVPFYDQCLSKSEVELKKMYFKNLPQKKSRMKRPLVSNASQKLKSKSYLEMFYAKYGVEKIELTNRATCRDLSPKSFSTCVDFELESFVDSSASESSLTLNDVMNKELSLSLTSIDSKLLSASQQNLTKVDSNSKKSYIKARGINIPELGSLGPEIPKDKLELLKKRQEYGQKVSQKNKIKMIEKTLLRNLQQEIKECKKIV